MPPTQNDLNSQTFLNDLDKKLWGAADLLGASDYRKTITEEEEA